MRLDGKNPDTKQRSVTTLDVDNSVAVGSIILTVGGLKSLEIKKKTTFRQIYMKHHIRKTIDSCFDYLCFFQHGLHSSGWNDDAWPCSALVYVHANPLLRC